jgi:two-component system chemotaxis response regulator CheB
MAHGLLRTSAGTLANACARAVPAARTAVRALFETDIAFRVCGEAENGRQAIQRAEQLSPDLVTMDLSMPLMNGLDAIRFLNDVMPNP